MRSLLGLLGLGALSSAPLADAFVPFPLQPFRSMKHQSFDQQTVFQSPSYPADYAFSAAAIRQSRLAAAVSAEPASVNDAFSFVEGAAAGSEVAAAAGDRMLTLLDQTHSVVGSVAYTEDRGKSLRIVDVVVSPSRRGEGLGRRVMTGLLERFLNRGGRISQVTVECPVACVGFFERFGLAVQEANEQRASMRGVLDDALNKYTSLMDGAGANDASVLNVLGRLHHDNRSFQVAGDLYTKALTLSPNNSMIFQNLGGAFASQGEHQLAFASFQRAIDLNPEDRYTYFKLGMMYEQLATGKFKEAAEHALRCYEFYLDGEQGRQDTDALTMYGNLLLKRLCPDEATVAYQRALEVDPSLFNVWFNLANAQLKANKIDDAVSSLKKTLELNSSVTAARHMLKSLTDETRKEADTIDPAYVVELFNYYAPTYDSHMKDSLLYTAPRMLRQEVRKVFNQTLIEKGGDAADVLSYLNKSMRILDLGCGTGLCGAWFTDYAKDMVGVDIAPNMIEQAKKKLIYSELEVADLQTYLSQPEREAEAPFDIIVSADVLQYLGDLRPLFDRVVPRLDPEQGLFAFTLEEFQVEYTTGREEVKKGYILGTSGRFLYTRAYVDKALADAGLVTETFIQYSPRQERAKPVPGFLYVVRRKRDAQI